MRAWHCREINAAPPTSCRIWTFNTDVHTVHTKIEVLFSESPDGHRASAQIVFYSLSCFPRSKRDGEGCCLPGMILLPLLCNTVTYTLLDRLLWIVVINLIFCVLFTKGGTGVNGWLRPEKQKLYYSLRLEVPQWLWWCFLVAGGISNRTNGQENNIVASF